MFSLPSGVNPGLSESGRLRAGLESPEWMQRVRLPVAEIVIFTRQLQVLLASGVPIIRALEVLSEQASRSDCAEVYFSVQRLVLEGRYLSAALSRFPACFPPMYVGLIRVGEQTGALVETVYLLCSWLERDQEVRQKIKGALTYPAAVVVIASLAVLALMNVLGPLFIGMFAETGAILPWPTRVVAFLISLQQRPWFWLLVALVTLIFLRGARSWAINPHWRVWAWEQASRLPGLGELLRSATWSRYCAALSILVGSGIQPQRSYRFAAEVSGDPRLVVDCDRLIQSILEGERAAQHMDRKPHLYPRIVRSSLELADDTGQGRPILEYLTRFYREDLEIRLQILQSLLEPLLLLATSAVLLFLILALMLPLYGRLQEVA